MFQLEDKSQDGREVFLFDILQCEFFRKNRIYLKDYFVGGFQFCVCVYLFCFFYVDQIRSFNIFVLRISIKGFIGIFKLRKICLYVKVFWLLVKYVVLFLVCSMYVGVCIYVFMYECDVCTCIYLRVCIEQSSCGDFLQIRLELAVYGVLCFLLQG